MFLKKLWRRIRGAFSRAREAESARVDSLSWLYGRMRIHLWAHQTGTWYVKRIKANKARYMLIERATDVPWQVVGVIHALECGLDFGRHLHNGDPLTMRTVRVPRGRPKYGKPPFKWEESAIDSLAFDKLAWLDSWSLEETLDRLERYNGLGYRKYHPETKSPYLWSGTQHYVKGKYASDGKYDSNLVSKQVGAAVLLKLLGY